MRRLFLAAFFPRAPSTVESLLKRLILLPQHKKSTWNGASALKYVFLFGVFFGFSFRQSLLERRTTHINLLFTFELKKSLEQMLNQLQCDESWNRKVINNCSNIKYEVSRKKARVFMICQVHWRRFKFQISRLKFEVPSLTVLDPCWQNRQNKLFKKSPDLFSRF